MKLQFVKHKEQKHVIRYFRDNGTETWMYADDFFVLHDLSHFAIEKCLCYTTAFYGLINSGVELSDFLDKSKRDLLPFSNEAIYAENMANLLLMEGKQGRVEDLNALQQQTLAASYPEVEPLLLSQDQVDSIRAFFSQLCFQWKSLSPGNKLELEIDV